MPRRKSARLKSRDPGSFKGLLIRINADGWRALRILAAERDTTLNALAIEALNDLLKKRGKPAVVENPLIGDDE
jgi:predicted HicB family RNase H-like nuclease